MAKRHKRTKDRLQALLEELSWYDPDEWKLSDEELGMLSEFYASLHRLMQLRGKSQGGIQLGAVTFREKPKGVRVK